MTRNSGKLHYKLQNGNTFLWTINIHKKDTNNKLEGKMDWGLFFRWIYLLALEGWEEGMGEKGMIGNQWKSRFVRIHKLVYRVDNFTWLDYLLAAKQEVYNMKEREKLKARHSILLVRKLLLYLSLIKKNSGTVPWILEPPEEI